MTVFDLVCRVAHLDNPAAASSLDKATETIRSWRTGRRKCPPEAIARVAQLRAEQAAVAERICGDPEGLVRYVNVHAQIGVEGLRCPSTHVYGAVIGMALARKVTSISSTEQIRGSRSIRFTSTIASSRER